SLLCDRVEDRLTGSGAFAIARNEDRAVAALDHGACATHGGVKEPKFLGRQDLGKTTRQLRRDRAHLNQSGAWWQNLNQTASAPDRCLNALERRQDRENGVSISGDFSDAPRHHQSLRLKRPHLLGTCVIAFDCKLSFEQTRSNCAAKQSDPDDADTFHL